MLKTNQKEHTSPRSEDRETAGKTLAPPAFQLKASSLESSPGIPGVNGTQGGYYERVAGFPRVYERVVKGAESGDFALVLLALEDLKNDAPEVLQFEAYFQEKKGQPLNSFLNEWDQVYGGDGSLQVVLDDLEIKDRENEEELTNAAQNLKNWLKNKEESDVFIMAIILMFDQPEKLAVIYKQTHGVELADDLIQFADGNEKMLQFARNTFGVEQNFENVWVANESQAEEARALIAEIKDTYGVAVNSQETLEIILNSHENAPKELKDQLKLSKWTLTDLRTLKQQLQHYHQITGEERNNSTRNGAAQEVQTIGRVNKHLSMRKGGSYEISGSTGGAYYGEDMAVSIYDNSSNTYFDQSFDLTKTTESGGVRDVIGHELGHGFLEYAEDEFTSQMPFWKSHSEHVEVIDYKTPLGFNIKKSRNGEEAPPTHYGMKNAGEDLAESVMLHFNHHSRFTRGDDIYRTFWEERFTKGMIGAPCKQREAFLNRKINAWKKKQKKPN